MQISENLIQSVINYLLTKPYWEVVVILNELQKEIVEQKKESEPKSDKK
jgi:hypothetical protein